ncbi:lipase family protein [Rhodococcus erythropolis]|nr:lipase family protein [Rhodococcus erythropolis]
MVGGDFGTRLGCGPPRAYGAAKLGGQITLDGIRAGQRFDALDLDASPVGMAGYSGVGTATAMVAATAPNYARRTRARGQRLRRRSDEHRQDCQGPGPATPGIRAGYGRGARSRT